MKTTKYLLGLCLLGLLSVNVFATGSEPSNAVLNDKIQNLLDISSAENENFVGIAIIHYNINENGVIEVTGVDANTESTKEYIYSHLDHKKIKHIEGINLGEHTLKVRFKN